MTMSAIAAKKAALNPENFALANCIRALSIDAVEAAKSGHPGAPMGMADAATVLYRNHLKFDAADPHWPDRDRFVLSNGHASMMLYSLLHLTGYQDMTLDQVKNFRQWGSITAGHPEYGHATGIETTTGPLGQGLATAVGMALVHGLEVLDRPVGHQATKTVDRQRREGPAPVCRNRVEHRLHQPDIGGLVPAAEPHRALQYG